MKSATHYRRLLLACALAWLARTPAVAETDPLPDWIPGTAKQAIVDFVKATTDPSSPDLVPPAERIATFDQDGTLWVEHPIYTQFAYIHDRAAALAKARPELAEVEPFKTVLSGQPEAIDKLSQKDLETLLAALPRMTVDEYSADVKQWLANAKSPRWDRPYTELAYLPMLELLHYLRANGYKTYIVTGGGQDFVRVYSQDTYGIPPEQVVGTADRTEYAHDQTGKPVLIRKHQLLLYDDKAGKPENIHLMIGRRPRAAFGNSTGDQQMLAYTKAGEGARLALLVLHDDPEREYAYGPAQGLPPTNVGTFTQALYDETNGNKDGKGRGWIVASMKRDWKRIFAFGQ